MSEASADPAPRGPAEPDPVEVLRRWERSGAVWRVLDRSRTRMTVGLFSCDAGEEMSRLSSSSAALRAFVGNRESSED